MRTLAYPLLDFRPSWRSCICCNLINRKLEKTEFVSCEQRNQVDTDLQDLVYVQITGRCRAICLFTLVDSCVMLIYRCLCTGIHLYKSISMWKLGFWFFTICLPIYLKPRYGSCEAEHVRLLFGLYRIREKDSKAKTLETSTTNNEQSASAVERRVLGHCSSLWWKKRY